jgi:hypothetical protein
MFMTDESVTVKMSIKMRKKYYSTTPHPSDVTSELMGSIIPILLSQRCVLISL